MSESNISKMNFKQLKNEVQSLRDELAVMKREYDDIIYNIDDSNLSYVLRKEKQNMMSEITVNAEEIKTKVSSTDLDGKLENYSTISQTALAITSTVNSKYIEDAISDKFVSNVQLTTQLKQTSDSITQTVSEKYETKNDAEDSYNYFVGQLKVTSDKISAVVSKNIAACYKSDTMPDNTASSIEKTMLCLYGGKYWYFNDIKNEWLEYPESGVKTMFEQTSDEFKLTGDVKISGDLITYGTISASRIDMDNLSCTKLYQKGNSDGYYVKIASMFGDFGVYTPSAADTDEPTSLNCLWGVFNSFPNVNMYVYGRNYFGFDTINEKFWPKGNWDFSGTDFTASGLKITFS